jgi:hypothetical protein
MFRKYLYKVLYTSSEPNNGQQTTNIHVATSVRNIWFSTETSLLTNYNLMNLYERDRS